MEKTCSFPQNITSLAAALNEHCGTVGHGKHMLPIYCISQTADGFSPSHINNLKMQVKSKGIKLDTIIWQRRIVDDQLRQSINLPEQFSKHPAIYQPEVTISSFAW
ncbi:MAG TPA: hypothetical protein VHP58_02365 [Alphaproteobacteria bacterium]|nr:hypothetical protein [Alphaproteobacteria bacterium]